MLQNASVKKIKMVLISLYTRSGLKKKKSDFCGYTMMIFYCATAYIYSSYGAFFFFLRFGARLIFKILYSVNQLQECTKKNNKKKKYINVSYFFFHYLKISHNFFNVSICFLKKKNSIKNKNKKQSNHKNSKKGMTFTPFLPIKR